MDENKKNPAQNPSTGSASSPQASSGLSMPPIVTEEEYAPPAPPPTSGGQNIGTPVNQSISDPVPQNISEPVGQSPSMPATPPSSDPPIPLVPPAPPSSDSILPPVMEPPKKKSRGKLIAGLAAVLLLVVSIPLAVFVIGQSTELREKAALDDGGGGSCTKDAVIDTTIDSNGCTRNVHTREDCSKYNGAAYDCPSTAKCEKDRAVGQTKDKNGCTRNVHQREDCTTYEGDPYACPSVGGGGPDEGTDADADTSACSGIERAGALVHAGAEGVNLGNQQYANCETVKQFVDKYNEYAGRAWAAERVCNSSVPAAKDGQNIITQDAGVVAQYLGLGAGGCQAWVNAHNTELAGSSGATAANQCTGVKIYKHPYNTSNEVKAPFGGKLAGGDPVKVCLVVSGTGGRPEVAFDGTDNWEFAGDTGPGGEPCKQHDIPAGASTLIFRARY